MNWKTLWDVISVETLRYVYFISSLVDSTFLTGVWATLSNLILAIYLFQDPLKTDLNTTCSFLFTWFVLWLSFPSEYSFMYLLNLENLLEAWTLFERKRFILCHFSLIIIPKGWIESQRIVQEGSTTIMTNAWSPSATSTYCTRLIIAETIGVVDIILDLQFLSGLLSLSVYSSASLWLLYFILFCNNSTNMELLNILRHHSRLQNCFLFILLFPRAILWIWVLTTSDTLIDVISACCVKSRTSAITTWVNWHSLWSTLEKGASCPGCGACISFSLLISTCL